MTRLATPISEHAHPKKICHLFNLCEFTSTCKKIRLFHQFILHKWLIKKSCNLIGWEHFGPYLRNQIGDLWRNIANNINFHYRKNSVKFNDKIFSIDSKNRFWPIFGPFSQFSRQKKIFLKIWPSCTISYGFLALCQNLQKNNTIAKNTWTEGRLEKQKDGQTLYHSALPPTAGGPTILTLI